ncbi:hypothetical protein GA0115259_114363, partial [Streptomyces sp. MnatMP-M17]
MSSVETPKNEEGTAAGTGLPSADEPQQLTGRQRLAAGLWPPR